MCIIEVIDPQKMAIPYDTLIIFHDFSLKVEFFYPFSEFFLLKSQNISCDSLHACKTLS